MKSQICHFYKIICFLESTQELSNSGIQIKKKSDYFIIL